MHVHGDNMSLLGLDEKWLIRQARIQIRNKLIQSAAPRQQEAVQSSETVDLSQVTVCNTPTACTAWVLGQASRLQLGRAAEPWRWGGPVSNDLGGLLGDSQGDLQAVPLCEQVYAGRLEGTWRMIAAKIRLEGIVVIRGKARDPGWQPFCRAHRTWLSLTLQCIRHVLE